MKFYNTFKRKDGNYVTQEWSGEDVFNYDILQLCFILIIGSLLSVLSSTVCLIVKLYDYEEDQKAPSIFGIIFSGYFVLDYYLGWPISFILKLIEPTNTVMTMVNYNASILIVHILLLIFGDTIYYNTNTNKRQTLIFTTIVTAIITYFIILCMF